MPSLTTIVITLLLNVIVLLFLPRFICLSIMLSARTKSLLGQAAFCALLMSVIALVVVSAISFFDLPAPYDAIAFILTDASLEIWIPIYFLPQVPLKKNLVWTWTACFISSIIVIKTIFQ